MQKCWRVGPVVLVLCLSVSVGGCKKERGEHQPGSAGGTRVPEVGGCESVSIDAASCELRGVVVTTLDPGQLGAKVVHVSHVAKVGNRAIDFESFQLTVPEARTKDLEAFFNEHSPVRCDGVIVRPPCNPDATAVKLKLTLPDYVKPHR